jgi:hypothetical protein
MGGCYREADVLATAHELAERHVHDQQPARLPDPAPKLLGAPGVREQWEMQRTLECGQLAMPIQTGWIRPMARNKTLGQDPHAQPVLALYRQREQLRQPTQ